jgi:hypothetical protein
MERVSEEDNYPENEENVEDIQAQNIAQIVQFIPVETFPSWFCSLWKKLRLYVL